jgi:triphosphoribosyl-dephospho-CoA synthase
VTALQPDKIAWAIHIACLLEVCADKPGNVTWGKNFWDTHFMDFMASAVAIGPALRDAPSSPIGETILRAVQDTRQLVNTNTNLGMILLLAPLAKAIGINHPAGLRAGVKKVLTELSVEDAGTAFQAIHLAAPGGLGAVGQYDVRDERVNITFLEAMKLAQTRDSVAREYATDFEITFELGFPTLIQLKDEGHQFSESIVQTTLTILAQVPDTLIARKEGIQTAQQISDRARRILEMGGVFTESGRNALRAFDQSLRDPKHHLNPGTTADLIAATLFVYLTEGGGLAEFPEVISRW